ncbi:MAG: putative bifunctional diguanylate cyclase/phosphodiesterase [Pseudomonadota bacterium]
MPERSLTQLPSDPSRYQAAIAYIRAKTDQLLSLMGTLPLRPEELDDDTLLELDPIGIVAGAFSQILQHLNDTNRDLTLARLEIRAILDALDAAVIVVSPDGRLEDCNRQARTWFFGDSEDLAGQPLERLCACQIGLSQLLEAGDNARELDIGGQPFLMIGSRLLDQAGQPAKIVLLLFDLGRQKQTEASLRLYAQVFEHTGEGILITDHDNRIIEVNAAFTRILGYRPEDVLGKDPRVLQSGLHAPEFYAALWRDLREKGYWRGEINDRTRDGTVIPLLYSISEVRDPEGRLSHHIALITDITHLKEAQTRLDFLAHHDGLTHLSNRLLFNDRLEQAIARAKRDAAMFALLFIDLDRFKTINDSLGHHVGDLVLIEVARRLNLLVRRTDTVARLGGDEFVVLMEKLGQYPDADRQAGKILEALRRPFLVEGQELHLGCSIGIALFPEDGMAPADLMKNADAAMYLAKERGRDNHARFQHDLADHADARLSLETALRKAEKRQAFTLHYQPIHDLARGRVVAAEALIRWPDAPAGASSPAHFIPLAEESRLILPIGEWVLRTALTQLAAWRRAGLALDYLSVNISAIQIAQPEFADRIEALLGETGLAGHDLLIEVTENILMRDIDRCGRLLQRLRGHGVRVAIDDFGTGYSSLAYLKQLPIDHLKIDRGFVQGIPDDSNDSAIAFAILSLSRALGLCTIAEGVETEAQEAYLAGIGCHLMQGFRYARPMPPEAFAAFIAARADQASSLD